MSETEIATPSDNSTTTETNEPTWYLDDNTPGTGARPDWLPAKYKKVSDVGRAYGELEKKLGGFTGAPESYDIASLELDANDPTVQALADVGKKHNMNQEAFQEMVGRLVSIQETTEQMNIDAEVQKLGKDGERMLTEYKNWVKDYLPAAEREVVGNWIKTADDLKAFNKMMAHTHLSQVPTHETMHMANKFEGVQDLRGELVKNKSRFDTDATYRKDWQSRMARAVMREKS
jgi:hypothetical protein